MALEASALTPRTCSWCQEVGREVEKAEKLAKIATGMQEIAPLGDGKHVMKYTVGTVVKHCEYSNILF